MDLIKFAESVKLVSNYSEDSREYFARFISRLAVGKPLTPIIDEDGWIECSDGRFRHIRCPNVMKDKDDGRPYYTDAIVFNDGENDYRTKLSSIYIDFPFSVPDEPERILLDSDGNIIYRENSWWQEEYGHLNKGHKYA